MKTIVTQIPSYSDFYKGRNTLEVGYPWLTFGAIMSLEKIMKDSKGQFNVLEMGSGGSTLFFEKHCKEVWSLEHSEKWADMVVEKLTKNVVTMVCAKVKKLLSFIADTPDESFDLILVDSNSGPKTYVDRQAMMDASLSKLKPGGWLVIDNYSRLKFDPTGYDVYTFDMFKYSGRGTKLCRKLP